MTDRKLLKYTKDHEWIDTTADPYTVGITDYAATQLGEIVYVDLPSVGDEFAVGDVVAEIESTKSVGEIYAPVAGKVAAVNDALEDAPETVNDDPFGEGWIFTLESADEPSDVLDAAAYAEISDAE